MNTPLILIGLLCVVLLTLYCMFNKRNDKPVELEFNTPVRKAFFLKKSSIEATVTLYKCITEDEADSMHPAVKRAWRCGRQLVKSEEHLDIQIPKYFQSIQRTKFIGKQNEQTTAEV